jgi:hypothetical protein
MALPTLGDLENGYFYVNGVKFFGNTLSAATKVNLSFLDFYRNGASLIESQAFASAAPQKSKIVYFMWGN